MRDKALVNIQKVKVKLMHRFAVIACVCVLVTLAAACGSSPPPRYYTLSAGAARAGTSSNLSLAVGPVSVPADVDRPQIVVSAGANQVTLDEFNQWAGPLQNNIARVVAENVGALLGTPRVALFSDTWSAQADYRVGIGVQRFESMPGEAAILDAVWTVRRTQDGKADAGRTSVREAVKETGYDSLAAGHSRALLRLSQDIANAVRTLERTGG